MLIDLSNVTEAEDIQKRIQALEPDEQAVCVLPTLPKAQFDKLVLSSRLPYFNRGCQPYVFSPGKWASTPVRLTFREYTRRTGYG